MIDDPEIDNEAMNRRWLFNTLGTIANIRAATRALPEGGHIISIGSGVGTRFACLAWPTTPPPRQ